MSFNGSRIKTKIILKFSFTAWKARLVISMLACSVSMKMAEIYNSKMSEKPTFFRTVVAFSSCVILFIISKYNNKNKSLFVLM